MTNGFGGFPPETLKFLREHIAAHWEDLRAITNQKNFKKLLGNIEGERLVRPPLGFPADHPAIDLLRQKQFYVAQTEPAKLAEGPKLFLSRSDLICRAYTAIHSPFIAVHRKHLGCRAPGIIILRMNMSEDCEV
jgi:hypothetical protein